MRLNSDHLKRALGIVLVIVASGLLITYIALGYAGAGMATVEAREEEFWSMLRIARRLAYVTFFISLAFLGFTLAEKRKVVTLYLRRFRTNTHVINPHRRGGLGRSIRLVTLQDNNFPSMALSRKDRWMLVLIPPLLLTALFLLVNSDLPAVNSDNADYFMVNVVYSLYLLWLVIFIGSFFAFHLLRLRTRSQLAIARAGDIPPAVFTIRTMTAWWRQAAALAPRSTLVEVRDSEWQHAVESFVSCAHVVLVDLTDRSENVEWELATASRQGAPMVLIATQQALAEIRSGGGNIAAGADSFWQAISKYPVLCYEPENEASLREFRKQLVAALRNQRRKLSVQRVSPADLCRAAKAISVYLGMAVLALAVATSLVILSYDGMFKLLLEYFVSP